MNDLQRIKRDYRDMRAPADLSRRIAVRLPADRGASRFLPAAAVLAAALAAAALLMTLSPTDGSEPGIRPTSLTVLSLASASGRSGAVPGLSSVRGMSLPPPPQRPTSATGAAEPAGTGLEDLRNQLRNPEEKDHANS